MKTNQRTAARLSAALFIVCPLFAQLLPPDSAWVEKTLRRMTLEEKVGQLFMPVHREFTSTVELVKRFNIGGIWFARTEARRIVKELNALQEAAKYPLLVSADFEKGAGTYVDGATDLPFNMALGATRTPEIVYRSASLTAREAKALGVHINFAPVLDVNNNPKNPVVNTRSFGENPEMVATLGVAAIKGYQDHGILATGKHFPGHGNTSADSHSQLGIIADDPKEFESIELVPYKRVLREARPSAIMSAHLWVKALDMDTLPATLSKEVMTGLLRGRLGFDGVVYTDAMVMGGITTRYPFATAVVRAIQSGCDVILFPGNVEEGFTALVAAVRGGALQESRIDESVRRILISKTRVGLQDRRGVDPEKVSTSVGTDENYNEARLIAAECLTLVKDEKNILPLAPSKKIGVIVMGNKLGTSMLSRGLVSFPEEMRKRNSSTEEITLSDSLRTEEFARALALAKNSDVVVVAAYVKIILGSGTVDLPPALVRAVEEILRENPNVVLISFGNPYIGASVRGVPTYICAYDNAKALQDVAADALFGKIHFKGKLPVTVSESMKFGSGIMK